MIVFLRRASLLLLCLLFLQGRPPELTHHTTRKKIDEIMKSHVTHKRLSHEIIKRSLSNFIEELDPTKTYLLEGEIAAYLNPSESLLEEVMNEYRQDNFLPFMVIYDTMLLAIERRNKLEKRVDEATLPTGVKARDFKDLTWAKNEEELYERLTRIRSLQLDVAEAFEEQTKEQFMQRVIKRRLGHEKNIINSSHEERERKMLALVIKSVSSSLDTHTNYFTPTEANDFMIQVQQRLFGIGAQLRDDFNGLTIVKLIEGGPALNSGKVKNGDRIIAVNHEPIVGMEITEAVALIRGPKGSPVLLTMIRGEEEGSGEKFDLEIIRDEIVLKETRFEVNKLAFGEGTIGHLRLFSFYEDPSSSSASDLKDAIEELKKSCKLDAVILDLRDNGGGLLTQAVSVTGLFIKKGIVVSIKDSNGHLQHLRNFNEEPVWDGPLMVLTNSASASSAEIVAQTLQDYGRALICGDTTYGKGTYQVVTFDGSNPARINPQGEFKVTRGMYYTVSGKSPQLVGTQVDVEIPGIYSFAEVGERFVKYPIENESIAPNFQDELLDIHPFHRHKIRKTYKINRQEPLDLYGRFTPILKANSEKRIAESENYQNFLKLLQKEDPDLDEFEPFGKNDLQLEECVNVMKDLLHLSAKEEGAKAV